MFSRILAVLKPYKWSVNIFELLLNINFTNIREGQRVFSGTVNGGFLFIVNCEKALLFSVNCENTGHWHWG